MKLTNGEIFTAREPLQKLMGERFPVKVSYGLAKLAGKLQVPLTVIDDVRTSLIRTYGETDPENEQQLKVNPNGENWKKFISELNELFAQEVEVDFDAVKLPQEVDGKPLQLEPNTLVALEKFIFVE